MSSVILQARVYDDSQLSQVRKIVRSMLEGLSVNVVVEKVGACNYSEVSVSGDDEKVALRYLAEKVGVFSLSIDEVERFSRLKGFVVGLSKSSDELLVDVGPFSSKVVSILVPLARLRAQIADGREVSLARLIRLFGLTRDRSLWVRILGGGVQQNQIEAELSDDQRTLYSGWIGSMLDRLIVVGASLSQVKSAVDAAGLVRDVVAIESLGILECAVVCKLGTDATGLIPRIGRNLSAAALTVFSPRRIVGFFGYNPVSGC